MTCKSCDYRLKYATIGQITEVCPGIKSIRLKLDEGALKFSPGQFIMVGLTGYGEVPLGITTSPENEKFFEVCVRNVGTVTRAIHKLKTGDKVGVRGPYGNGFDIEGLHGSDLVIIAGGLGMAPLHSIVDYAKHHKEKFKGLQVLCGARCPEEILYLGNLEKDKDFANVLLTVDDADKSWQGEVGVITNLIPKVKVSPHTTVIMCGPPIMYKFVIPELEKLGIQDDNIQILLERRMKCGIGKCQHCTFGDKYVCLDGPVFKYSEIKDNIEAI